jgi:hypothetical protein
VCCCCACLPQETTRAATQAQRRLRAVARHRCGRGMNWTLTASSATLTATLPLLISSVLRASSRRAFPLQTALKGAKSSDGAVEDVCRAQRPTEQQRRRSDDDEAHRQARGGGKGRGGGPEIDGDARPRCPCAVGQGLKVC